MKQLVTIPVFVAPLAGALIAPLSDAWGQAVASLIRSEGQRARSNPTPLIEGLPAGDKHLGN
jgi:hypothetical protein